MGTRERERARKLRRIERAKREAAARAGGTAPPAKRREGRRPNRARPAPRQRRPALRKLRAGETDQRGRVFQRDMLIDPKVGILAYLASLAVVGVGLFVWRDQPLFSALVMVALAVGMFVLGDMRPTKRGAYLHFGLAALLLGYGVALAIGSFGLA